MGRVLVRPTARRDQILHFAYIGENKSIDAGRRFLADARTSFLDLAQMPHLGAPHKSLKAPTLRMWRIRHFEKYLIFYMPIAEEVQIERIIHAAQDYTRILSPEPPG